MAGEVEKIFEAYDAAMSAHDVDAFLSLFTDDCIHEDVPMGVVNKGKQELGAFTKASFAAVPDLKMERKVLFIAGNRAATEWIMSGTQTADIPGIPATNKSFSVRVASIFELEGERIKRQSDYWSLAMLLQQVGLMPKAPQE